MDLSILCRNLVLKESDYGRWAALYRVSGAENFDPEMDRKSGITKPEVVVSVRPKPVHIVRARRRGIRMLSVISACVDGGDPPTLRWTLTRCGGAFLWRCYPVSEDVGRAFASLSIILFTAKSVIYMAAIRQLVRYRIYLNRSITADVIGDGR